MVIKSRPYAKVHCFNRDSNVEFHGKKLLQREFTTKVTRVLLHFRSVVVQCGQVAALQGGDRCGDGRDGHGGHEQRRLGD